MELVIFDLETTGFSPRYDDIIQIAAVRMRQGEVVAGERFATYVAPRRSIPPSISEMTGITQQDVSNAPAPSESLASFSRFVGNATLVAHNGWRFDLRFIREACQRHHLPTREVSFFDSMQLSHCLWPNETCHNLDAVMTRLELSGEGLRRHDARGDVGILAEAVRRMWLRLGASPNHCPVPINVGHLPH